MNRIEYISYLAALFVIFLNCSVSLAQPFEWSEGKKLSWKDFKGKPTDTENAAMTKCGISFLVTKVSFWSGRGKYEIKTSFYPDSSWYHSEKVDDQVLQHEQTHFDIAELHGRKIRREILSKKMMPEQALKVYHSLMTVYEKEQVLYEKETEHGTNESVQLKWTLLINNQLKEKQY